MSRLQWTLVSIAMLLVPRAAPAQGPGPKGDARAQEIQNRLASQKTDVDFDNMPLEEALGVIRGITGYNIVLSKGAKEGHADAVVTLKLKQLSVKTILRIMLGEKKLTLVYREGIIQVVPLEELNKNLVTKVYDVKDLVYKVKNFAGPKVELVPPISSGGGGGTGALSGAIFAIDEETAATITEDFLEKMIRESTGGGDKGWTDANGKINKPVPSTLLITHTEKVHQEITDLLRLLRQFK
jgi:hypothetical protein